jgi:putative tryptophan/tyrosine transport system substrate-binding protein
VGSPLNRRSFLRSALSSGGLLALPAASSPRISVRAFVTSRSDASKQILEALAARLPTLSSGDNLTALAAQPGRAVYLAIGPAALHACVGAALSAPVVSLFSSRAVFSKAVSTSPVPSNGGLLTAVYAETSPATQLQLISAVFQRRVSVGALLSAETSHLASALQRAATMLDVDLRVRVAAPLANTIQELSELARADALLLVPDAALYTPDNLRSVLESTYRRNQPVFGYSPALVTAGALGSTYAAIEGIATQASDLIAQIEDGHIPDPQYPTEWRVAVNESVARSLNLGIPPSALRLDARSAKRVN